MVNFLLKEDILESTVVKSDQTFRIANDILDDFVEETNIWYYGMALSLVGTDDYIKIYNPSVDLADERDPICKQVAIYHCLMEILFSLSKEPNDIFWTKYLKLETKYNNLIASITSERVQGILPAETISGLEWGTFRHTRG